MAKALEASGTELVTVALRRVDLDAPDGEDILDHLDRERYLLMPNTSGAMDADEAVRLARLARAAGLVDADGRCFLKLEVTPEPRYLLPDPSRRWRAAELLVADGFVVLPYIPADPVLAKRLEEVGCATVMPLGSWIGTQPRAADTRRHRGDRRDAATVPVVVDAGIGAPSHASDAMEMGCDAVLVNTAIATARDPVEIAHAFRLATRPDAARSSPGSRSRVSASRVVAAHWLPRRHERRRAAAAPEARPSGSGSSTTHPDFALDVATIDALSAWSQRDATRRGRRPRVADRRSRSPRHRRAAVAGGRRPARDRSRSRAHELTVRRFGRTMHLFAPLYLSNECVSECTYCGFQVWNRDIVRRTLSPDEVAGETRYLKHLGFRHVLLVAGEHPKHVSADYVGACIAAAAGVGSARVDRGPGVGRPIRIARSSDAGCDGVVLYQETYDARVYPDFHLKGNKRFFDWRLGAPERAARAGVRRIGIGALLGLNADWRFEVLALAAHARFLMRRAWRSDLTVALPRLEPAAGFDDPPHVLTDVEFTLAICALRLALPDAGIVLSTREPARLRDGLARLGVTHMSAGSRTEPGGYEEPGEAEPQFEISDERAPSDVAAVLSSLGYDPVWKDDSPVFRRTAGQRL